MHFAKRGLRLFLSRSIFCNMGKAKIFKKVKQRNEPLEKQITTGKVKKEKSKNKGLLAQESGVIDSQTSKKIITAAKNQKLELEDEFFQNVKPRSVHLDFPVMEDNTAEIQERDFENYWDIDKNDAEAFERFKKPNEKLRTSSLADIIKEKTQEKYVDIQSKITDDCSLKIEDIDPRIRELYEGVRDVLKRYRSGKVPKAFKIIPRLRNWEQILFITEPHNWSAAAMFQGTRIFCSALSQSMAQRFCNLVLLPRIRDDLSEYKKLNMHLYNALRKALFKPAAFMKGIILPLLESGDCTLREAIIIGSVIAKNSIPVLHSSACLLKICEMEYTGANSVFIRYFLDKRYALPYRVVDAAVFHFLRFKNDDRAMTVLWHQSVLTFVQRYKNDISSEQKEALLSLLKKHFHPKITPLIRRELQCVIDRDEEMIERNDDNSALPMAI